MRLSGITPAHAGKSSSLSSDLLSGEDHPRPCGEKSPIRNRIRFLQGSPPPMRGKVGLSFPIDAVGRITPAHAGKSSPRRHLYYTTRDHPRPCGEKAFRLDEQDTDIGSPPPMRGKGLFLAQKNDTPGITPAHAGKSHLLKPPCDVSGDHPRPCGEKPNVAPPRITF